MIKTLRLTGCAIAALSLSGCQSFVDSLGFGPRDSAQTERHAEVFGGEEIEKGRLALEAGHVTLAIQQFRMAALNEKYAADAFNGLGVAYARLGRADLAERYFRTAVELDTSNPKYAANLARFYQSPLGERALAMRQREAEAMLAQAEQAAAVEELAAAEPVVSQSNAVTVVRPAVGVERSSNREVRISAAPATIDSASPVPAQQAAAVLARPAQQSRISLAGRAEAPQTRDGTGPVRITVLRGGGRWTGRPRMASYPVRVALRRED